jgi:hypothetical protein
MYFEIIGEIEGLKPMAIGDRFGILCGYGKLRDWLLAKTEGDHYGSSKKWRPCIELRYIGTKPTGSGG